MRVLYYNWADPLDPERRGGGVSVYQRNLMAALSAQPGIEVACLSSGLAHDLRPGAPRIARQGPGRYTLVNSGLIAPSHADFAGSAQIAEPATEAAFAAFVDETGPWDVIHFNTLEGLPASVLALRARWPATRFVLSLHNYYPFCPQVNLWFDERETCTDDQGGAKCARCLPVVPQPRVVRMAYAVETAFARLGAGPGTMLFDRAIRPTMGAGWRRLRRLRGLRRRAPAVPAVPAAPAPVALGDPGAAFRRRREVMTALINDHCDSVICVSDRVRQLACQHGLDPARMHVLHVGSAAAEAWAQTRAAPSFLRADGTLHAAYLGYMRRDKGFHFLMDALGALPADQARRLHLTVAARAGDGTAMAALEGLRPRLGSLTHVDGYTHAELPGLLAGVGLGLIPVLWEDNLPQVAIEMHARHIPLLTSDRGGARELGNCPALVFRAGDAGDFHRTLGRVLDGQVAPADYWAGAVAPVTLSAHLDVLLAFYRGDA